MLTIIAVLLTAHFVGDFVFQRSKWAQNKSTDRLVLTKHVSVYALTLCAFSIPIFGVKAAIAFALLNSICHWLTDAISSQFTSYYWKQERVHAFFVVIGLDQLVHYVTMLFILSRFL